MQRLSFPSKLVKRNHQLTLVSVGVELNQTNYGTIKARTTLVAYDKQTKNELFIILYTLLTVSFTSFRSKPIFACFMAGLYGYCFTTSAIALEQEKAWQHSIESLAFHYRDAERHWRAKTPF